MQTNQLQKAKCGSSWTGFWKRTDVSKKWHDVADFAYASMTELKTPESFNPEVEKSIQSHRRLFLWARSRAFKIDHDLSPWNPKNHPTA